MVLLALVPLMMFGFGFAMVPLYDVFCEAFGIRLEGGDGRIASADATALASSDERFVTVHFDASVDSRLPWQFAPTEKFMTVRVGELTETTFVAANRRDEPVIGHAVPSVAPVEASIYLAKTECFCFDRQQLAGHEQREMPVRFIIDPELPANVKVLTLAYRFYRSEQTATVSAATVTWSEP